MLSCHCDSYHDWYYESPTDFMKFEEIRRKRCVSCNELINIGADCLEFKKFRIDEYGDEIYLANIYMCEKCGEIFLNLNDLGYCITLGVYTMQEYLTQYWDLTGFKPKE